MEKKIIIKGAIGSNPRKDRDGFRVLGGGGYMCKLTSSYTYRTAVGSEE